MIINNILEKVNLGIVRLYPRHSVRFAIDYFKDKEISVIEIGTLEGRNAISILQNLNVSAIYLIDPYEKYEEYKNDGAYKGLQKAKEKAHKRLEFNYYWEVNWIEKYSDDALKDVPLVDFIYIDGNHTYNYVKRDIENYWSKLKVGGILAGHDITHDRFGGEILLAVAEFCIKNNLKPYSSRTDWWIVKGEEK